jgi:hypothetical protein
MKELLPGFLWLILTFAIGILMGIIILAGVWAGYRIGEWIDPQDRKRGGR